MIKKLTISHTKIITLITNPSEDSKQGRSFTLEPVGWDAIFDVSQQMFGFLVCVAHHSKFLQCALTEEIASEFQASLTLEKHRCL